MSSDTESFTSHSGSIEQQLESVLELGTSSLQQRVSATEGGGANFIEAAGTAGPSSYHRADDVAIDESSHGSFSEEGEAEGEGGAAAGRRNEEAGEEMQHQQVADDNDSDGSEDHAVNGRMDSRSSSQFQVHESGRFDASSRDLDLRTVSRQHCKKSARRGYDFKLMLVGESGIGKTTLIDSLFNVESTRNLGSKYVRNHRDTVSTTKLCERFFELEEGGVTVRLTVIDTPGFATELDSRGCVEPVLSYVERQLDDYYRMEQGTDRSKLQDGRVHALLYLINPSSRGLRQLDVMCMKALHSKVNIVPVIGKADSLTPAEKASLKASILQDLGRHGISTYTLPEFDECFGHQTDQTGDDVYLRNQYDTLRGAMPLAVVGSSQLVKSNTSGQWIRVREYPWGIVDIENPEFSDFLKLRELLIQYMEDFKERTHEVIYEQIRLSKLRQNDWQMSRMSKTLAERDRLLREKEDELRRLREAVEGLQRASTSSDSNSRSSSLPTASHESTSSAMAGINARAFASGSGGGAAAMQQRLTSSSSAAYGPQLRSRKLAMSSQYN